MKRVLLTIISVFLIILCFQQQTITNTDSVSREDILANKKPEITIPYSITHNIQEVFQATQNFSLRSVAVGHIHPDGGLRVIYGSHQGSVGAAISVFNQTSQPFGFTWEGDYFFDSNTFYSFEPFLTYDFDQDGVDEILGSANSKAMIIGWNGSGYYPKWNNTADLITIYDGAQMFDVNGDGKDELISNTRDSTYVYSWDPGFTNFKLDATLIGGAWFNVGIGDITNDNKVNIVTTVSGNPEVRIYTFENGFYKETYLGKFETNGYSSLEVVDIDNDHKFEMFAGSPNFGASSYGITKFEWDGSQLQAENVSTSTNALFEFRSGDIDGDSLDEVFTVENGGNLVIIEYNQDNNSVMVDYTNWNIDIFFEVYDINGDGFSEVVSLSIYYDSTVLQDLSPRIKYTLFKSASSTEIAINKSIVIGEDIGPLYYSAVDIDPLMQYVYINGSKVVEYPFDSGKLNQYHIPQNIGLTNVTIVFDDQNGHYSSYTFFLIVNPDLYSPLVNAQTPINIEQSNQPVEIKWQVIDTNPNNFTIYVDGIKKSNGTWVSYDFIRYTFVPSSIGTYSVLLVVGDDYNNVNEFTTMVNVKDTIKPLIESYSASYSYEVGSTGNFLEWKVSDMNPDLYEIYFEGELTDTGSWDSGTPIKYNIDQLPTGTYKYELKVYDKYGNQNFEITIVTVSEITNPTTTTDLLTSTSVSDKSDTFSSNTSKGGVITTTNGFAIYTLLIVGIYIRFRKK